MDEKHYFPYELDRHKAPFHLKRSVQERRRKMISYNKPLKYLRIGMGMGAAILGVVTLLVFLPIATAGEYPVKPIRLIYPWPAGSSGDIVTRLLAEEASKLLGGSIGVTNVTGGQGTIGTGQVAQAKPDGYTLGSLPIGPAVTQPIFSKELSYKTSDLIPICQFTFLPMLLVANAERPFKTAAELIDYAKKHQGEIVYGHPGEGSVPYLSMVAFLDTFGIKMKAIPFKGLAPALAACVGGHVDVAPSSVAAVVTYRDAGKIRILALFDKNRLSALPDVPTVEEIGVKVYPQIWTGIFAPKGTPEGILQKLYAAFGKAAQSKPFLDGMAKAKQPVQFLDHKAFSEKIAKNVNFFSDFVAKQKK
jgi:tripartite-type tricarboxylate transporter receptor subunit TctC